MSYMKQQWLEREQLRAELMKDWPTPAQFRREYQCDFSEVEQRVMANLPPSVPGVAPPMSSGLKAIMEGARRKTLQEEVKAFYDDWGDDPGEHVPPETRVQKPTCEADKPEGTRDVDKFLKEQQDKLWRGD